MFLLDTNVVSEWVKPVPNPGVMAWLASADEDQVFLSVVTLAELRYGVDRMPQGRRRPRLSEWLTKDLPLRFEGRILPIDAVIANACGKLMARNEAAGNPREVMDAFIAATAETYQLTLITRNTAHFHPMLQSILNPWS
jgi:predicted nucleic acid-binding protein